MADFTDLDNTMLNIDPNTFNLNKVIILTKERKLKVSIVIYDDGDKANNHRPICGDIFIKCWKKAVSPANYFELEE